ncbi:MAG: hypothetical protein IJV35_01565 [Neisseriaceae bacterium]|nr:hypothetical protein [Neisseriaceae bacterium]
MSSYLVLPFSKTRPNANTLGDIFVSDKSLTNIVVLDNASISLSGSLKYIKNNEYQKLTL